MIWYLTNIDEATSRSYVMVSPCKNFPCAIISGVKIVGGFYSIIYGKKNWKARSNFLIFSIKILKSKQNADQVL